MASVGLLVHVIDGSLAYGDDTFSLCPRYYNTLRMDKELMTQDRSHSNDDSLVAPYAPPGASEQEPRTSAEPLPSLMIIVLGFAFCLLCHTFTTFALFQYIDKTSGPTAKAIDSFVFGYVPIIASVIGSIVTIAMVSFGRAMLHYRLR